MPKDATVKARNLIPLDEFDRRYGAAVLKALPLSALVSWDHKTYVMESAVEDLGLKPKP